MSDAGKSHSSHIRNPRRAHRALAWFVPSTAAFAVCCLVVLLPVRFPSFVNTTAAVASAQKWILVKGPDGQLIARTFNYRTGMNEGYRVSNFNAGSSIAFSIDPTLAPGAHIDVGDTVGSVSSTEMQERLVVLKGQLAAAQRLLVVDATGQKAAIVNEAQKRLESAKRRRDEYEATVTRTRALLERHLIPERDYERVFSEASTLEDQIAIAEAAFEVARTGAKPEQLALVEANIAALKDEINAIHATAASYTIKAPIAGTIASTFSGDTLLTITATSPFVALIPIRWNDYWRVANLKSPQVTIVGFSRAVRGRVVALNREVESLYGERVVMATALLDSPPEDLLPGSLVRCRVDCNPLTAVEYAKVVIRSLSASAQALGSY
jgi:hypothetical protein